MRAAIDGIKLGGQADVGDKTLLDALVLPMDELDAALRGGTARGADGPPRRRAMPPRRRGDDRETRAGGVQRGSGAGIR